MLKLYIQSSIHVALSVSSLAVITFLEFEKAVSIPLLLFIFLSGIVAYNGIKYLKLYKETGGFKSLFSNSLKIAITTVTTASLAGITATLFFLKWPVILASVVLGLITLAYATPVLNGAKNLRQVYGLKIFMIGFVWAGVTVLLPVLHADPSLIRGIEFFATFLQRLLFVIALTIPFDIRDRSSDPDTLGTIPMIFGNRNAVLVGILLLMAVAGIEFSLRMNLNTSLPVFIFIMMLTALLLARSVGRQSPWLASFWIEGIPILWVLLLILFS